MIEGLVFPQDKKQIAKLSYEKKMEWYGHQFYIDPFYAAVLFASPEFKSFWKWHVLIPVKIRRMFYRIKNFEIFKRYKHISEMRIKEPSKSIKQYMI